MGHPPAAPTVSSFTHSNPEKWYSNNNPEFSWQLPPDVTQVRYAIDQNSFTVPKFIAETLIDRVSFTDLVDGIWYFHINFRNQFGWEKITRQKVLIDTTPPLPFKIEVQREYPTDPQPTLFFESSDELSGIDYYKLIIGEEEPFQITSGYKLPPQAPGKHLIKIKAFDGAGNYTLAQIEIEILPLGVDFPTFLKIGKIAIDYLTIIITLILLIVGAVAVIFYAWYQISIWRKRIRIETKEAKESVVKSFRVLRKEVQEQIEYLDKKPGLNQREKAIRDKLQEALNVSEELISKEIKDIEKELE